jgi:hypothetical protein
MSTMIESYCIDCKAVAQADCDVRGHVVGTLGSATKELKPTLDTEGEWRVLQYKGLVEVLTPNQGHFEVAASGNSAEQNSALAAQIVTDRNAAIHEGGPRAYLYSELQHVLKSQALLVEALEILRSTLTPVLRDHAVRRSVDRAEGYVLVAVNQIDAALKAASGLTERE